MGLKKCLRKADSKACDFVGDENNELLDTTETVSRLLKSYNSASHRDPEFINDPPLSEEDERMIYIRTRKYKGRAKYINFDGKINVRLCDANVVEYGDPHSSILQYGEQLSYEVLKSKFGDNNMKFVDKQFPCDSSMLYKAPNRIEWLRPHEIYKHPLFESGLNTFTDMIPGISKSTMLLNAMAVIKTNSAIYNFVVNPKENDFNSDSYFGLCKFRFWSFGSWIEVYIDDRLPCLSKEPIYIHSKSNSCGLWWSLLEKAFAKLRGGYAGIYNGHLLETVSDLSGAFHEYCKETKSKKLQPIIYSSMLRSSFVAFDLKLECGLKTSCNTAMNSNNMYGIIDVNSVDDKNTVVRVKNYWGTIKWKGAFSKWSPEWHKLPEYKKKCLTFSEDDSDTWISITDLSKCVNGVHLWHADLEPQFASKKIHKWSIDAFKSCWLKNVTSGGGRNRIETFANNPQYRLHLLDTDVGENLCTVVVNLLQNDVGGPTFVDYSPMGFLIYPISAREERRSLSSLFFRNTKAIYKSPVGKYRQLSARLRLSTGNYIIVPFTTAQDQSIEFMLKVASAEANNYVMLNDDGIDMKRSRISKATTEERNNWNMQFEKFCDFKRDIDVFSFHKILNILFREYEDNIGMEVTRCIFAMADKDINSVLSLNEFNQVMNDVYVWVRIFEDFAHNSLLKGCYFREVFMIAGFRINAPLINLLFIRFGDDEGNLNIDNFLNCAVKVKQMIELYEENKSPDNPEFTSMNFTDWLKSLLYS